MGVDRWKVKGAQRETRDFTRNFLSGNCRFDAKEIVYSNAEDASLASLRAPSIICS